MAVMPGVSWKPVVNCSGTMSAHQGLVLHVQAGNGSLAGWFNNPSAQASSTWWAPKSGTVGDRGRIEQYVDSNVKAWAQSQGNATWNSVETEGYPNEPLTDYQIWACGQIMSWGRDTYGWPMQLTDSVTGRGLGWHGMGGSAWGGHTGCPGDIRKGQRQAILDSAGGVTPAPTPPPEDEDDMVLTLAIGDDGSDRGRWYITDLWSYKTYVPSVEAANQIIVCVAGKGGKINIQANNQPVPISTALLRELPGGGS